MGCDIHVHVEMLVGGQWRYQGEVECWRDYRMFELLAGVRGHVSEALFQPRGLPADIAAETLAESDSWGGDAHTPHWLSSTELATVRMATDADTAFPELHSKIVAWYREEKEDSALDVTDYRLVFWFDN